MQWRRNLYIGLYKPVWQLKSKLSGQVQFAGWSLARIDFSGLGLRRHAELEDKIGRHHKHLHEVYDRDSTPDDCMEARSSLLRGR
jgi:hypothetical protein